MSLRAQVENPNSLPSNLIRRSHPLPILPPPLPPRQSPPKFLINIITPSNPRDQLKQLLILVQEIQLPRGSSD